MSKLKTILLTTVHEFSVQLSSTPDSSHESPFIEHDFWALGSEQTAPYATHQQWNHDLFPDCFSTYYRSGLHFLLYIFYYCLKIFLQWHKTTVTFCLMMKKVFSKKKTVNWCYKTRQQLMLMSYKMMHQVISDPPIYEVVIMENLHYT